MKSRAFVLCLAALALCGCAGGWFSGRHPQPHMRQGEEWHPPRAMLLKYDANHDGIVSRFEMEEGLKADFAKADTNHDGHLDPVEARAVNQERWTADSSTASPLVDWNQDGFVDYDEFAATARSLFDELDTDGDGKLSPAELNPPRPRGPSPEGGEGREGRHGQGGGEGPGDPDGD